MTHDIALRGSLVVLLLVSGCTAGTVYRAEPLQPEVAGSDMGEPRDDLRVRVEQGLLSIELERAARRRWRERDLFRERARRYDPGADVVELIFFPVGLAGYVALSPVLAPLDGLGEFTSYVDGFPDRRPWGLIETLATGALPGITTHYYAEGLADGDPTGGMIRGPWREREEWVRTPVGGAHVELRAPDGKVLAELRTNEAGRGAIVLRNLVDVLDPYIQGGQASFLVVFGETGREIVLAARDLR